MRDTRVNCLYKWWIIVSNYRYIGLQIRQALHRIKMVYIFHAHAGVFILHTDRDSTDTKNMSQSLNVAAKKKSLTKLEKAFNALQNTVYFNERVLKTGLAANFTIEQYSEWTKDIATNDDASDLDDAAWIQKLNNSKNNEKAWFSLQDVWLLKAKKPHSDNTYYTNSGTIANSDTMRLMHNRWENLLKFHCVLVAFFMKNDGIFPLLDSSLNLSDMYPTIAFVLDTYNALIDTIYAMTISSRFTDGSADISTIMQRSYIFSDETLKSLIKPDEYNNSFYSCARVIGYIAKRINGNDILDSDLDSDLCTEDLQTLFRLALMMRAKLSIVDDTDAFMLCECETLDAMDSLCKKIRKIYDARSNVSSSVDITDASSTPSRSIDVVNTTSNSHTAALLNSTVHQVPQTLPPPAIVVSQSDIGDQRPFSSTQFMPTIPVNYNSSSQASPQLIPKTQTTADTNIPHIDTSILDRTLPTLHTSVNTISPSLNTGVQPHRLVHSSTTHQTNTKTLLARALSTTSSSSNLSSQSNAPVENRMLASTASKTSLIEKTASEALRTNLFNANDSSITRSSSTSLLTQPGPTDVISENITQTVQNKKHIISTLISAPQHNNSNNNGSQSQRSANTSRKNVTLDGEPRANDDFNISTTIAIPQHTNSTTTNTETLARASSLSGHKTNSSSFDSRAHGNTHNDNANTISTLTADKSQSSETSSTGHTHRNISSTTTDRHDSQGVISTPLNEIPKSVSDRLDSLQSGDPNLWNQSVVDSFRSIYGSPVTFEPDQFMDIIATSHLRIFNILGTGAHKSIFAVLGELQYAHVSSILKYIGTLCADPHRLSQLASGPQFLVQCYCQFLVLYFEGGYTRRHFATGTRVDQSQTSVDITYFLRAYFALRGLYITRKNDSICTFVIGSLLPYELIIHRNIEGDEAQKFYIQHKQTLISLIDSDHAESRKVAEYELADYYRCIVNQKTFNIERYRLNSIEEQCSSVVSFDLKQRIIKIAHYIIDLQSEAYKTLFEQTKTFKQIQSLMDGEVSTGVIATLYNGWSNVSSLASMVMDELNYSSSDVPIEFKKSDEDYPLLTKKEKSSRMQAKFKLLISTTSIAWSKLLSA